MKRFTLPFLAVATLVFAGCNPDLVVEEAKIDFNGKFVHVRVANIGKKNAGSHLTYIEINNVNASASAKPEAQYSASIPKIAQGGVWDSGPIEFTKFSTRPTIDLNSLETANLVVRVDAKGMVKETNEDNNLYDMNH